MRRNRDIFLGKSIHNRETISTQCHVMAHGDEGVGMILPPPVELTLSRSQKVTVRRECGSRRCSHLSDLGSPDIGRGKKKEAK